MNKIKFVIIAGLFFLTNILYAENNPSYRITENSFNKVSIAFKSGEIRTKEVQTEKGSFTRIFMDDFTLSNDVGNPQLPVMVKLVEIPLCEEVQIRVTASDYTIYNAETLGINYRIFPTQPSYPKSYEGPIEMVMNDNTYSTGQFYGSPLASVEKVGIMRSINLASVSFAPVEYNPVTNEVKIYNRIEVEITFVNADIPQTYQMKELYGSEVFSSAAAQVINPVAPLHRNVTTITPTRYLIIAHSSFKEQENLQQFIAWKKRIGYIVDIAYTDDANVGTSTTTIKNYILSQYTNATETNPAPTYLLLIGDVAQIPAYTGQSDNSHVTDLYYATWTHDNIPDCYYGRYSARTVSELIPQIVKTLQYEQYTMSDPSYLDKAVLVAGYDNNYAPTYANGQVNYISNNYVNTAAGYSTVNVHLHPCSSDAATIRSEIGEGRGLANYTAHCNSNGWSDPEFSNSQVASMNNTNKYGLMIGNCCLSGKFDDASCFGETLLRTANKGAMAYIGASNSTYWSEDYYWAVGLRSNISANPTYSANNLGAYDKLFHTHNEDYSSWFITNGSMIMGGNLAVQSSGSSFKLYYWEIYHLFGDPSIKTYLTQPSELPVTVSDVLFIGSALLSVSTVPHAYVALTKGGEVVSAVFSDENGEALLPTQNITEAGTYELAVSAQHYIQHFSNISVMVSTGSYVIANSMPLSDGSAPTSGTVVNFDINLSNIGSVAAFNVYSTVESNSDNLFFTTDSIYVDTLSANSTVTVHAAFQAIIANNITDATILPILITTRFNDSTTTKRISLTAKAPNYIVTSHSTSVTSGNTDNYIDPGETFTLTVNGINNGSALLSEATAVLSTYCSNATIHNHSQSVGALQAGLSNRINYSVSIDNNIAEGTIIPLYFSYYTNSYHYTDTLFILIGKNIENFESNSFTQYSWVNGSNPWIITTTQPYEGTYCARSKNNLSDDENSTLKITHTAFADGTFSYYRKVSSEQNYDFFKFYIDDVVKESLSGAGSWGTASFDVTAGTHTYKFEYSKDYSTSSNSDCAFIDNISFPPSGPYAPMEDIFLAISNFYISNNSSTIIPVNIHPVLNFSLVNHGNSQADNVKVILESNNNNLNINGAAGSNVSTIAAIASGQTETKSYTLTFQDAITGTTDVNLIFKAINGTDTLVYPVSLTFSSCEGSGIAAQKEIESIIFPNPAKDEVTIITKNPINTIEIIDFTGKVLRRTTAATSTRTQVNISNLSDGIYFVRMIDADRNVSIKKIIKQ